MRLYHVSDNPNLKTLIPRVPRNSATIQGLEDSGIKRISFAPSIQQAITGTNRTVSGRILYVYQPVGINEKYLYKPNANQVYDVGITSEVWYLRPVEVKLTEVIVGGKRYKWNVGYFTNLALKRHEKYLKQNGIEHPDLSGIIFQSPTVIKYKTVKVVSTPNTEYNIKGNKFRVLMSMFLNRKL